MGNKLQTADHQKFYRDELDYWHIADGRLHCVYLGFNVEAIILPFAQRIIVFLPERWPKNYLISNLFRYKANAQSYLDSIGGGDA